MASVDFIYDPSCPNVARARVNLAAAFTELDLTPSWLEWDTTDPAAPNEFREQPSPTILVNGRDIDPDAAVASGRGCRIYFEGTTQGGVPPVALLVRALARTASATRPPAVKAHGTGYRRVLAVVPSLSVATIPVGLCPVCFAGYAGAFGALGLGFLLERNTLAPLAAVALLLALGSLAWRARSRWGYGPLALGALGALVLWLGQFVAGNVVATTLGATTLLIAAVWNSWPRAGQAACAACPRNAHSRSSHFLS
ncbi:MAG: hypothetical protein AB7E72_07925 [Lysobacterales bacterium]